VTAPPGSLLATLSRPGGALVAAGYRFYHDQCLMRASALAYTSLLSLVPLLALMFAVLKGLGAQERLEPLLLSRLSLDQATTDQVIGFIDRTNVGTLGAVGAAALVFTVLSVLGTIEASFNDIWRVARARTFWRQVSDYLGVVLLTPFLLLAATAIASASQVQQILDRVLHDGTVGGLAMQAVRLSPLLINAVALGILYAIMPNRRPAPAPLVISALLAGAAWHVMQTLYVALQVGVARYDAIYGALAQLPVTLVWLYVSWAIVLAGAELAAVLEYGGDGRPATVPADVLALELLVRAADAFTAGAGGIEPHRVARALGLDVGTVWRGSRGLVERGWLVLVDGGERIALGCEAAKIAVAELPNGVLDDLPPGIDARVRALVARRQAGGARACAGVTLMEVLQ